MEVLHDVEWITKLVPQIWLSLRTVQSILRRAVFIDRRG